MKRFLPYILLCLFLLPVHVFGQCPEEVAVSYELGDSFTCQIDFQFSFKSLDTYESATAFVRNCEEVFESETIEQIDIDDELEFNIPLSEVCGCSIFEPLVILTKKNEDGEIETIQCIALPVDVMDAFDVCPEMSTENLPVRINGEFECTYEQEYSFNSPIDLDRIQILLEDCNGVNGNYILENIIANETKSINILFDNDCSCDLFNVQLELIKDDFIVDCYYEAIMVDDFNFITFPLELGNFEINQKGNQLYAEWATLFEISVGEFVVEYSETGTDFVEILNVIASQGAAEYSHLIENKTGYYRLKVINLNGEYGFSPVIYHERIENYQFLNGILELPAPVEIVIYNVKGEIIYSGITNYVDVESLSVYGMVFIHAENYDPIKYFKP